MIANLLDVIWSSLQALGKFLTVIILGLVAGVLLILPWLLRAIALLGWFAGTFLLWKTVDGLYSSFTPALPLFTLSIIPAFLSSILVVWLFYTGQQEKLWGTMALWGIIGCLVWKGSMLLVKWEYGLLVMQVLPAALSAVLLFYINIRWGTVIRARRLKAYSKV